MAKVEGREKLNRKLKRLPEEARKAIRSALEKSADELVAMMKRLVPVGTGDLRDSIGWTWGNAPKGSFAVATAGSNEFKITVYAGDEKAFYARFVEFGTSTGVPAQPYFFPSYRARRRPIKARISRAVRASIKKVAAS